MFLFSIARQIDLELSFFKKSFYKIFLAFFRPAILVNNSVTVILKNLFERSVR